MHTHTIYTHTHTHTLCVKAHVYLEGDIREMAGARGDGEMDGLGFDDTATNVFEGEELVLSSDVAPLSADLEDKVRTVTGEGENISHTHTHFTFTFTHTLHFHFHTHTHFTFTFTHTHTPLFLFDQATGHHTLEHLLQDAHCRAMDVDPLH